MLLAAAGFVVYASRRGGREAWRELLTQNAPWIAGGVFSIFVWAIFASPMANGMDLWICAFYIVLFRMLRMGLPAPCDEE